MLVEDQSRPRLALMALWDKTGCEKVARRLRKLGFDILASDGTATYLRQHRIRCQSISDIVGKPILGHRVVTLDRRIYAMLLADRENQSHMDELAEMLLQTIDVTYVTLYPLEATIAKPGSTKEDVIESTDIGGPTLLRASAKARIPVASSAGDMETLLHALESKEENKTLESVTALLCAKAEFRVSRYALISAKYHSQQGVGEPTIFSGQMGTLEDTLKAENGWQGKAGIYITNPEDRLGWNKLIQLHGPMPSYNNWNDVMSGIDLLTYILGSDAYTGIELEARVAVVLKHGQACGAALSWKANGIEAAGKAIGGNPLAAFGGAFVCNYWVTEPVVKKMLYHRNKGERRIMHNVVAPGYTPAALDLLKKSGGKDCRVYVNTALASVTADDLDKERRFKYHRSSFGEQDNYSYTFDLTQESTWFTGAMDYRGKDSRLGDAWDDLEFLLGTRYEQDVDGAGLMGDTLVLGRAICGALGSNTIVLVKDRMLIGTGAGQVDRVGAAELAIKNARRSRHKIASSFAVSDSFFPFSDGVEALGKAGVSTILATRGSRNDEMVFARAEELGIVMITLPDNEARGFRH